MTQASLRSSTGRARAGRRANWFERGPSTGTIRIAVIVVREQGLDPANAAAQQGPWQQLYFGTSPTATPTADDASVADVLADQSRGAVQVTGAVYGPYTEQACATPCLEDPMKTAARADGYDPAAFDYVAFAMIGPSASGSVGGYAQLGGDWSVVLCPCTTAAQVQAKIRTAVHELNHSFGLEHANRSDCVDANAVAVSLSTECTWVEYGDRQDVMGASRGISRSYAEYLGWVPPARMQVASGDGVYQLASVRSANGNVLLRIPRLYYKSTLPDQETLPMQYQYLDLELPDLAQLDSFGGRVQDGVDAAETVLVRVQDRTITGATFSGNISPMQMLVDADPATRNAMRGYRAGETLVDGFGGITIEVLSASAAGATVRVDMPDSLHRDTTTPVPPVPNITRLPNGKVTFDWPGYSELRTDDSAVPMKHPYQVVRAGGVWRSFGWPGYEQPPRPGSINRFAARYEDRFGNFTQSTSIDLDLRSEGALATPSAPTTVAQNAWEPTMSLEFEVFYQPYLELIGAERLFVRYKEHGLWSPRVDLADHRNFIRERDGLNFYDLQTQMEIDDRDGDGVSMLRFTYAGLDGAEGPPRDVPVKFAPKYRKGKLDPAAGMFWGCGTRPGNACSMRPRRRSRWQISRQHTFLERPDDRWYMSVARKRGRGWVEVKRTYGYLHRKRNNPARYISAPKLAKKGLYRITVTLDGNGFVAQQKLKPRYIRVERNGVY